MKALLGFENQGSKFRNYWNINGWIFFLKEDNIDSNKKKFSIGSKLIKTQKNI